VAGRIRQWKFCIMRTQACFVSLLPAFDAVCAWSHTRPPDAMRSPWFVQVTGEQLGLCAADQTAPFDWRPHQQRPKKVAVVLPSHSLGVSLKSQPFPLELGVTELQLRLQAQKPGAEVDEREELLLACKIDVKEVNGGVPVTCNASKH
jgi:hypothetical protein